MARTVVSYVRSAPRGEPVDAVLEANAFAVAEDLEVRLVLAGDAVEAALAGAQAEPLEVAGVAVAAAASGQDLRALIESGVAVHALADDVAERGLGPGALVDGVLLLERGDLAALLRSADAVVAW